MSGWGIVAAGLGGGADSVGRITEGYIDQDRRLESARVLSEMEEQKQMRLAEFGQKLGREQQTYNTTGQGADEVLGFQGRQADVTNAAGLRGKVAEAGSTELTAAQIAREKAILEGLTPAKVAAEKAEIEGTAGAKAKAAGMVARATDLGGAERAVRTELASLELKDKKRLGQLYDEFLAVNADTTLTPQQRAAKLTPISSGIQAIKSKNGTGSARDPELDTETIVNKTINPDGSETSTTRKQVRRPGAAADEPPSPYPDGTELKGKDGNVYVVRDGQPVLKTAAAPAPAKKAAGIVAAANSDPLAGLSREQIRAKRAELQSELTRWADQPNAATRVAEIKTLLERIDNGQF